MTANSDHFDLSNWYLTLPIDNNDKNISVAKNIMTLDDYEHSDYFYHGLDGAMTFRAFAEGATTKGSHYARSELREMVGSERAAWSLEEGGTMSATLKIDEMPVYSNGKDGRFIVGQIHGEDDELVRLYYQNNSVYFKNEHAGANNKELSFSFTNDKGENPDISLNEKFSYMIDAHGDHLTINIFADGDVYTSDITINTVWQSDEFYFKAGVYMGINEDNGSGVGQASFYALDFGHTENSGMDAWMFGMDTARDTSQDDVLYGSDGNDVLNGRGGNDIVSGGAGDDIVRGHLGDDILYGGDGDDFVRGAEDNDILYGDDGNDTLHGNDGDDILHGNNGDDILRGHTGDDILYGDNGNDVLRGHEGSDILIGGAGEDRLYGGADADIFVFQDFSYDTVMYFSAAEGDRLDISALLDVDDALQSDINDFVHLETVGSKTTLYVNADGHGDDFVAIAMLHKADLGDNIEALFVSNTIDHI